MDGLELEDINRLLFTADECGAVADISDDGDRVVLHRADSFGSVQIAGSVKEALTLLEAK
jgi:hypothetical protein